MSFFIRIGSEERPSIMPSLPQSSSDQASRLDTLNEARSIYRFNYTHVSPLAMVDSVPAHDEFSFGWILKMAERAMTGLANLAEVEGDRVTRDEYLRKVEKYKFHLHIETDGANSLRELVSESLKFEFNIWGESRRPASIDDYAHLFHTIHLPPVARDYNQDPVFAAMRLAGPNPVMIQLMTRRDERLPVTDEHLHTVCPRDSLDAALAEGRLYLADYGVLDGVECGSFPHGRKYLYAPLALFVVDASSQQVLPVAIQCQQRPAEDNPVFTCRDGFNWLIAKTIVEIADGNVHEAVTHLGRTHILMEPFVVCMFRQLPLHHPVHQLLFPHFQGTLAINKAAWQQLIADRGAIDKLLGGTIQESRRLAVEGVQSIRFDDVALPTALSQRGVADTTCLPTYPYRDDATLYWNAIHSWVTDYIALYYPADADVAADGELQAWYSELQSHDGGRVRGMGTGGLGSRVYLINVLTTIIYTCSVQHAAVNFPQYDLMSYVPNMPLAGYMPAPQKEREASQQDYLDMLPPTDMAALQGHLGYLLGTVHYTQLGEYERGYFSDQRVAQPLKSFQRDLADIGGIVEHRNQHRRPYDFLLPTGIPQSINI